MAEKRGLWATEARWESAWKSPPVPGHLCCKETRRPGFLTRQGQSMAGWLFGDS